MTRTNNLDFLRFLAASTVVLGHGQALSGTPVTQLLGSNISTLGVMVFFAISGYLITDSWERQKSFKTFIANRCLRIFPALVSVTVLTAFILGPFVTSLITSEYFKSPLFIKYLQNIALNVNYVLPGVFENNNLKFAVNGSLWSLPPEFACYIMVAIVGIFANRFKNAAYLSILIIMSSLTFYNLRHPDITYVFYGTELFSSAGVIVYFLLGSIIRLYRINLSFWILGGFIILYALLFPTNSNYLNITFAAIITSYGCLKFGFMSTPILRKWGRFGDLSYGIYLYSFPIQQTLVHYAGNGIGANKLIFSSYILSILFAFLSWHLIEKQALKLKPKREMKYSPIPSSA
ncbi:acyltransferase family protein [Brucella lupini]|uniref:Acyltransferase n=1 Tax=Brucella lupini TaxID=255457 RepID=A0A256GGL7_9HYPH|nr:acyltransferase [Brucella lupini]KAB2701305.1 acyltransferase [Brucella lupini]OYR26294.1 acyltransferase family protein [Brucella lupini]